MPIETFVETPRDTGAVYRASGWINVGTTQGRGRHDQDKLFDKPRKDVWLRPLGSDWRRTLNRWNPSTTTASGRCKHANKRIIGSRGRRGATRPASSIPRDPKAYRGSTHRRRG